jgi:FAD synthase
MGDQLIASPLPAHRTAQTQSKRTQTSMAQVGVEPTIPVFEQSKTVHVLDCTATVIGWVFQIDLKNKIMVFFKNGSVGFD